MQYSDVHTDHDSSHAVEEHNTSLWFKCADVQTKTLHCAGCVSQ